MFIAGGIHQITKAPEGRHVYGIRRGPVPYRYLPNGYGTAERAYYLKQKKQG